MTRVNLPVGASIPLYSAIKRILYALTDHGLKYESDKKDKLDKAFTPNPIEIVNHSKS